MKNISKILGLGILSLAALSCTKESGQEKGSDELISIGAEVAETKAFLEGAFNANSTITVYDYLTPTNGTAGYHMEDVGVQYNGSDWSYVIEYPHRWEEGNHKFFGWMTKDGGMNSSNNPKDFFGDDFEFNTTSQTLTIPSKKMTASIDQFDFVYSDVYTRDYAKGGNSSRVDLNMNHLFTAISFGVVNTSSNPVTITGFQIEGLYDTNKAVIDFKNETIAYGNGVKGGTNRSTTTSFTLPAYNAADPESSEKPDVFNRDATANGYYLMWPHDGVRQILHSGKTITENTDGTVTYPDDYLMSISYTIDNVPYTKRIDFPSGEKWEAGKKYHYSIEFAEKQIQLICHVSDWVSNIQNINYDSFVSMKSNGMLKWDHNVSNVDDTNKTVYITNNVPAKGDFHFDTPVGGTWIANLSGDVDAFRLEPSSGAINELPSVIRVTPIIRNPERDYKVTVEFVVRRSDGRIIDADGEIQKNGKYTIILEKSI